MKWRKEYATGIQQIDNDHRMIFKMAEDYRNALYVGRGRAIYSTFLDSLQLYCRGHFGYEEQCMNEYRCPVAQKNKVAHAEFLEVLSSFQDRYAKTGYDARDAQILTETVQEWLSNHICDVDIHLKRCVKSRAE